MHKAHNYIKPIHCWLHAVIATVHCSPECCTVELYGLMDNKSYVGSLGLHTPNPHPNNCFPASSWYWNGFSRSSPLPIVLVLFRHTPASPPSLYWFQVISTTPSEAVLHYILSPLSWQGWCIRRDMDEGRAGWSGGGSKMSELQILT